MFNPLRCGWLAAIFALGLTGCVDLLEVGPWPLTPYQLGSVSLRCAYAGEEGWVGEVRHAGELRLRLSFTPDADAPIPRWKKTGWPTGGPTLNLRPPGEGPEVKGVRAVDGAPGSSEQETGHVRIDLGAAEPFAGLLPADYQASGALVLWQGGSSLAPEG